MSNTIVKAEKKYDLVKTTNHSYVTDAEETVIESRLRTAVGDVIPYVGSSFGITVATMGIMTSSGIVTNGFIMPAAFLVYLSLLLVLGGATVNYRIQRLIRQSLGVSDEWIKENVPGIQKARTFKSYYGLPTREQNFQLNCFPVELSNDEVEANAKKSSFVKENGVAFLPTFIVTNTLTVSRKGAVIKQVVEPTPVTLWDKTAQEIIDIQGIHETQIPSLMEEYIPDTEERKVLELEESKRMFDAQKRRIQEVEEALHYERIVREQEFQKRKAIEADIVRRAEEAEIRRLEREAVSRVTHNLTEAEKAYMSNWERDRLAYAHSFHEEIEWDDSDWDEGTASR